MGRRWGKTVLGGVLTLNTLRQHGKVAWIVPTYKNGRSLWRYVQSVCYEPSAAGLMDISKTERIITTHAGGLLGIFSADNIDAIRGEWFHLVVLDEAARISEEARNDAIMPTLADADGDEIDISTPAGLNWFFTEHQRGKDDMKYQAAFHAPTSANPSPQIQKAFAKARERVVDRTFRQEWLAEFISDGSYFQKVDEAATITHPDQPADHAGHSIIGGIDFALSEDYTVLTLGCRECNRVVDWDRFNQIDYTYQRERIIDRCKRWRVAGVLPERNSIGQPNIELLMAAGLPVQRGPDNGHGFNTTASSKPLLIQKLAGALEHDGFRVPADFADELRSYQVEMGSAGHPKFNAPEGMHDDRVMSLALCWWGMTGLSGADLVSFG